MKFDCERHGWHTRGTNSKPCPHCLNGDAPKRCEKHAWASISKPCPSCMVAVVDDFNEMLRKAFGK